MRRLELGGRDLPDFAVQASVVEPVDIFRDSDFDVPDRRPPAFWTHGGVADALRFEQRVQRLGHRVVVAVSDRPDRCHRVGLREALGVANRSILDSGVAVMDQPGGVLPGPLTFPEASASSASSVRREALRGWVKQAEFDAARRRGGAELEREVRKLRRANEILKTVRQSRLRRLTPLTSFLAVRFYGTLWRLSTSIWPSSLPPCTGLALRDLPRTPCKAADSQLVIVVERESKKSFAFRTAPGLLEKLVEVVCSMTII